MNGTDNSWSRDLHARSFERESPSCYFHSDHNYLTTCPEILTLRDSGILHPEVLQRKPVQLDRKKTMYFGQTYTASHIFLCFSLLLLPGIEGAFSLSGIKPASVSRAFRRE